MNLLIQGVTIIEPGSGLHRQKKDIFVSGSTIQAISDNMESASADQTIDGSTLFVSPGWMDLRANFCDPGQENQENLETGTKAASAGGFTHVGLLPQTNPAIATKTQLHYIKTNAPHSPTLLHPYATISKPEVEGEITEMVDLHKNGAFAFTDGAIPIKDSGLLKRAMLYTRSFNGLLMLHPQDPDLQGFGEMNEGTVNVTLGLNGDPAIAEYIAIAKNLEIVRYTGARVHFSNITTSRAVEQIQQAKQEGLPVSCDVSIHHLLFSENDLMDFNPHLKFLPPLRTAHDQASLKEGVKNGIIDAVVSNHMPALYEHKQCEFPLASYGAIGVQTLFPLLSQAFDKDTFLDKVIRQIMITPKDLLGLPAYSIQEGSYADLTLFNMEQEWTYNKATNHSRAQNSPVYGTSLKGKVHSIINNGQLEEQ